MANVLLSQIIPTIKDYARNSNLTDARVIRAINTATAFIKNQFGIPGYEALRQFNFFDDENFYTEPVDFSEPISLRFDNDNFNQARRFTYKPGELLYSKIEASDFDTLLWGHDFSNGMELIVIARNSTNGFFIDSMKSNNSQRWTAHDDATNIQDDPFFLYPDGKSGALEYDINVALSVNNRATIVSSIGPYDWSQQVDNGYFKVFHWIPNITNYSSVSLNISSDGAYGSVANYSKITVTTQENGAAFVVGLNKLAFPLSTAVTVGTPVMTAINLIWLQDNYTGAYISTTGFRYANLTLLVPDVMDETYYTKYKGKDKNGASLVNFSATDDVFLFGNQGEDDIAELVALWAGVIINPTILVDDKSVEKLYANYLKLFARKYPKKKVNNLLAEPKIARTSVPF